MNQNRYNSLDGIRTICMVGIVLMQILVNGNYQIGGWIGSTLIPNITNFVFVFMTINTFGMCCGYYDKIVDHKITLDEFYIKRLKKMVILRIVMCCRSKMDVG